jgi:2-polyprenyl-3-methyl-5-hydroxy-6-metoxy-1,4-benzoquinol methylase
VPRPPWNHNIHYHDLLLAAIPPHARRALDVGCGEGILARKLRDRVEHVIAIDIDRASIDRARGHEQHEQEREPEHEQREQEREPEHEQEREQDHDGPPTHPPIEYIQGDFLTTAFEPETFDFVVSVAALHHMDAEPALTKMATLLTPGGTLAVLGLNKSAYPRDLPRELAAAAATRVHRATKGWWESPAPQRKPSSHTYGQICAIADKTLPQARASRHLLWRYSIIWARPAN